MNWTPSSGVRVSRMGFWVLPIPSLAVKAAVVVLVRIPSEKLDWEEVSSRVPMRPAMTRLRSIFATDAETRGTCVEGHEELRRSS